TTLYDARSNHERFNRKTLSNTTTNQIIAIMRNIINVILSGGVGARLWPLSRKSKPKQYLPIINEKSLFKLTIERNQAICEHVVLVGSVQNIDLAKEDLKAVSHDII